MPHKPDTPEDKDRKRLWKQQYLEARADIGEIPAVQNVERREACKWNLRKYLTTYQPQRYVLPFSVFHLEFIQAAQIAVTEGLCKLIVFPRGSGKTSICRDVVQWATLYGHIRFAMLFGAEMGKTKQHMQSILNDLLYNERLLDDFPEVCYPIAQSEGIANRARFQRYRGDVSQLRLSAEHIIFPTLDRTIKAGNDGSVIGVGTITGSAARGPLINSRRPDFALIDDPQTRASAKSPMQCKERLDTINGDILGMAGPTKKMSVLMTATVIEKNDAIDLLLDHEDNPEWDGHRVSMIQEWPKNRDKWDSWYDIVKACLVSDTRDLTRAHDYYLENKAEMDGGSQLYWDARVLDGFTSAVESAMFLYYRDPSTFASEYQNDPLDKFQSDVEMPSAKIIAGQTNRYERFQVPEWSTHLTAFIDVQGKMLYYLVYAWADQFTGAIVDYGTFPDQKRKYFTLKDARKTFFQAFPGAGFEGCVYKSLWALTEKMNQTVWQREDGTLMSIDRGLIDANYGVSTEVVYRTCADMGPASPWMPSHGRGIKTTNQPMNCTPPKKGEDRGPGWYIPRLDRKHRPVRHVNYDTNFWKSLLANRWQLHVPDPGSQTIFKSLNHRMLAEQCNAEYAVKVQTEKRSSLEWFEKPNLDNHFFDCMVGCMVAASISGVQMREVGSSRRVVKKKTSLTREELQKSGYFRKTTVDT